MMAGEVGRVAQWVTTALMAENARCASISLYMSMQCRIDYFLATHLPSETREMGEIVDAALRECYAQVIGKTWWTQTASPSRMERRSWRISSLRATEPCSRHATAAWATDLTGSGASF